MAAPTVIFRNLGRSVSLLFLRKAAAPSRQLSSCVGTRPLAVSACVCQCHSMKTKNRRPYSVDGGQNFEGQQAADARIERERMEEEEEYEHNVKEKILNAALNHVQEYGWSKQAIEAGAAAEGLSSVAHGMFKRGGAEVIGHLYRKCNAQLAIHLKQEVEKLKAEGVEKPKTRLFIQDAVVSRLKMIAPYHDIWKEAMAMQTLPQNAPESWQNLLNLVDDIWHFAGDRSTDFDWYTKRFSLAAVYKATEIYMLQDKSPDFQDTWLFLDNRLNNMQNLGTVKRSLEPLKEGIIGMCKMGRNIVGMNSRNR